MLSTISQERSIDYQPALDGVRAVAVCLVLFFHAGFGWMPAGYLGVSVFFTLSGYLITTLLVAEHADTGSVAFGRFYARRARRLLPASLLCIALVVMARSVGLFDRVETLRRDSVSAILQVFNWVRLSGTTSYSDLFRTANGATTSPLEHYWSLSIEEQFYLVWPLAVVGLLTLAKRREWPILRPILATTFVFAAAAPLTARWFGSDAAYWATSSRLAEILLGACLAAHLACRRSDVIHGRYLAAPLLATIVALSCTLPSSNGAAYNGLLPVFGVVSAALIYALQVPGTVRSVLSSRPMVSVGRVSYGLYLFHWPIFVAMRQHGWNLASPPGFALAMLATTALTVTSYFVIELPVRRARVRPRRTLTIAACAIAGAVLSVAILPAAIPLIHVNDALLRQAAVQPAAHLGLLARLDTSAEATTTETGFDTTTSLPSEMQPLLGAPPSRPVRILVVGDSTALYLAHGLAAWSMAHPQYEQLSILWCQGCGFVLAGEITSFNGASFVAQSNEIVAHDLPVTIDRIKPDIVVLMSTVNDVTNREWTSEEGPISPSDPRFRKHLLDSYREVTASILQHGVAHVAWIVPPVPTIKWNEPEMREPLRYELQHEVIRQVAAESSLHVDAVDVDNWLRTSGLSADATWRPDGVHLTEESATLLAERFLAAALIADALAG